ncbi:MAG: MFS transporter [Bacteroidales bacterium]|nr:MFS transporter [Bacteroidota bacterium]MBL6949841.1 MFS transporter [Bacteroidales bacterium]
MQNTEEIKKESFPRSFWTANLTELFERGAYYAMASFVVLYLGQLGLGNYWPSNLNGILWALVFFLPILSGTIADQIGFKKSLLIAFVLLAIGYFIMGYPVWFGNHTLNPIIGSEMSAGIGILLPIILAILFIGVGGSIIKPCIAGTVQKTAGAKMTLGFGIFYMIINIGSLVGRGVSFVVRKQFDLSYIFAVSVGFSILAFFAVLFFYTDPDKRSDQSEGEKKPKKSILRILADMILVLKNPRFALFLIVSSGFFFIYAQVYNVLPLYLQKVVELNPAVDLITMANPFVIVFFQLLITKKFGKMKPINSIIVGIVIIGISMMINLIPIFMSGGVRALTLGDWIPMGTLFITLTVALIAFGELFTSARTYEFIGALAPKGQEGLFLGYANLPLAIGALIGGPAGAFIFHEVMCHGATKLESGLLELNPFWNSMGWIVLMAIGFISAFSMWLYNRWLQKNPIQISNQ